LISGDFGGKAMMVILGGTMILAMIRIFVHPQ
jgi:hypothetical protein